MKIDPSDLAEKIECCLIAKKSGARYAKTTYRTHVIRAGKRSRTVKHKVRLFWSAQRNDTKVLAGIEALRRLGREALARRST